MTRRNSRINLESVEIFSKLYSRILKEIYEGDLCINRSSVSSVTTSDSIINKLVNTLKHRQLRLLVQLDCHTLSLEPNIPYCIRGVIM